LVTPLESREGTRASACVIVVSRPTSGTAENAHESPENATAPPEETPAPKADPARRSGIGDDPPREHVVQASSPAFLFWVRAIGLLG